MFGARFNHETRFFIASGNKDVTPRWRMPIHRELSGIESIDISHQASAAINYPLGTKKGITVSSGPVSQTMALSRYLIYDDPI